MIALAFFAVAFMFFCLGFIAAALLAAGRYEDEVRDRLYQGYALNNQVDYDAIERRLKQEIPACPDYDAYKLRFK